MSENIINFDAKAREQKHGIKKKEFNRCRHNSILADEHLQQLECGDCGQVFSAWEYILKACKHEQSLFDNVKWAKQEKAQLDSDLVEIKRKIRNAKSQLKRAVK